MNKKCSAWQRPKILVRSIVKLKGGLPAKLIFVLDIRKNDWLAFIYRDITLSNEDIVRIYGKRWDIEVFFKMVKHHLRLEKERQCLNYDALMAHNRIVLFGIPTSNRDEPQDFGELFSDCCEGHSTGLWPLQRLKTFASHF